MWCNKCQRGQRENKDGTCPDCGLQIANPVEIVEEESPSGIVLQKGGSDESPSEGGLELKDIKQPKKTVKRKKKASVSK